MPDRSEITLLLELPGPTSHFSPADEANIDPHRRKALAEHRGRMFDEMAQHDRGTRRTKEKSDREIWLREMAQTLEIDVDMLLPEHASGQTESPEDETEEPIGEDEGSVSLSANTGNQRRS